MIKHAMDKINDAVHHVNPGQPPVVTMDQPLYALGKQIQWKWPDSHGEHRFVLMLGGLHTEMAFLKAIGHVIANSGWCEALVEAKIALAGTADSFLSASHVTRTRYAHEVTACALYGLMSKAYSDYMMSVAQTDEEALPYSAWRTKQEEKSSMFHYWSLILDLQMLLLVFVGALRSGNFELYLQSLQKMAPWFFALDHINYARWVSVHIHDLERLQDTCPVVHGHFLQGKFVYQKSARPFSKMALDQAHEQNNAVIKGDGGAVGLTESPAALRRWMISGPEVSQVIQEFEEALCINKRGRQSDRKHHEQTKSFQESFHADLTSLMTVLEDQGSPFTASSTDLLVLHNKDIVSPAVVTAMKSMQSIGQSQYQDFVTERLLRQEKAVSHPLKKNNLPTISNPKEKTVSKNVQQRSLLRRTCSLFSKLYVACVARGGQLRDFFRHENQPFPPSLSDCGEMRQSQKSVLMECLEEHYKPSDGDTTPEISHLIIDGAAVVNMIPPGRSRTFGEYADLAFLPYLQHQLRPAIQRLDVVWDR